MFSSLCGVRLQNVQPQKYNDARFWPGPFSFPVDRGDKDMWRFYDNTRPTNFCGRDNVVVAGSQQGFDASVGTKDFIATTEYILQYTVSGRGFLK